MLSLFAMNFHAARLGFEAQNAIAFRLLRLAGGVSKPAANDADFDAMSLARRVIRSGAKGVLP